MGGLAHPLAHRAAPSQLGLGRQVAGLGHAPQLIERQGTPEFVGMPEQFQSLRHAAFDQAAFERLAEQADQCRRRQWDQLHGKK